MTKVKLEPDKIGEVIYWAQTKIFFDDLQELMQNTRFLACQSYAFADAAGAAKTDFSMKRVERKKKFAELVDYFKRTDNSSIADAKRKAEVDEQYQVLYKTEKDAEARADRARDMLFAIKGILDVLRQETAELRAEKRAYVEKDLMEKVVKKVKAMNDRNFTVEA